MTTCRSYVSLISLPVVTPGVRPRVRTLIEHLLVGLVVGEVMDGIALDEHFLAVSPHHVVVVTRLTCRAVAALTAQPAATSQWRYN